MTNPRCSNCYGKGYTLHIGNVSCPNCGGCGHVPDSSHNELNLSGRVICPRCGGKGIVVETFRIPCPC